MEIHHKMCCSKHWDRHNHFTTTHLMIIVYTPPFYMVLTTFLYMWICSVLSLVLVRYVHLWELLMVVL